METTLGQLPVGSSFLFGNVVFVVEQAGDDEIVTCKIAGQYAVVYISSMAWVRKL